MLRYQNHLLRKGRFSEAGRPYLVTFCTRWRMPYLADPGLAAAVCRKMHRVALQGNTYNWCFVVMPDHVHWLFSLEQGDISRVIKMTKGSLSHLAGRPLWQKGFHDHALRSEEALLPTARYVVANPLRAGLVRRIGDYPYWDAVWL